MRSIAEGAVHWVFDISTILSGLASAFGVATVAMLVSLSGYIHSAEKKRNEILEDRLRQQEERVQKFKEEIELTEKWGARKKDDLMAENEKLKNDLEAALTGSGLTLEAIVTGRTLEQVQASVGELINQLVQKMEKSDSSSGATKSPGWHLELAKGYMVRRDWARAAVQFDRYVQWDDRNYEVQFSRATAHANARGGREENLAALRAYNEAIALAPSGLSDDMRARLFSYRGAMLKRLGRLTEAKADLLIGLSLAKRNYEIGDIRYNLACVYALEGYRDKVFEMVDSLRNMPTFLQGIRSHLTDYFATFAGDEQFLRMLV